MNPNTTPYQATALDQLLYTIAHTTRILQIDAGQIEALTATPDGCMVFLKGKPWTIHIPQREYSKLFVADRKARSQSLQVTQHLTYDSLWTVWNEDSDDRYRVIVSKKFLHCDCQDWELQAQAFGYLTVGCEHCYAVLARLGFGTLKDFLKSWQSQTSQAQAAGNQQVTVR
ncbi:MAG: hypothetical protein N5P05_004065 (plasmid) [Chroococcopsis gigantea SAG 12.99]|jgi:hypothetical protein|nr:hypothetical protein [Chroococcopsis gigantea SAG 12.99]